MSIVGYDSLSAPIFKLYTDDVIHNWQMDLSEHFMIGNPAADTLLSADDQAIQICIRDSL